MKSFLAAAAMVALVACSTEKKSVADDADASMPAKSGCCEMKAASSCSGDAAKMNSDATKKSCSTPCATKPQG